MSHKINVPTLEIQTAHRLINTKREKAWSEIVQTYGKTFYYQDFLATCDPTLVQSLLMEKVHTEQRSKVYKLMGQLIGADGLLFMDGADWQKRTQAVMPTLSKTHIDRFPEAIHQTALEFAAHWQDGEQLDDLFTALTEMGAAIALRVGGGLDPDRSVNQAFATELIGYKSQILSRCPMRRFDEFGTSAWKLLHLPWLLLNRFQLKRRVNRLRLIVQSILEDPQREENNDFNWFDRFQNAGFSLAEVTDQVNHLYFAFNAVDFVITGGFYELSRHPEWVSVLRTELRTVLGHRAYPTREDFSRLPYTVSFMREVLRCYPGSMGVMRRTGADITTAKGETIPKHTEVMILLYALHHHPDFWDRPDQFNPDRWLSNCPPHPPYAYIPFLDGARQCIGRHWAELEFVVILNALLQRYEFNVLNPDLCMTPFMMPRFSQKMPCIVKRVSR